MASDGYNMNKAVKDWAKAQAGGLPGEGLGVKGRNVKLYSRKNFLVGTSAPSRLKFFDETEAPFVQTIVTQSQLPANMALMLNTVRIGFVPGIDRMGNRLGQSTATTAQKNASALSFGAAAAAAGDILAAQWKWNEKMREMMNTAIMNFGLVTDQLWEVSGLTSLPDGKGMLTQAGTSAQGTVAGSNTGDVFQSVTNGAPVADNYWAFATPWPLVGSETFKIEANWPKAVDFAEADIGPLEGITGAAGEDIVAGTIICELQGLLGVASS